MHTQPLPVVFRATGTSPQKYAVSIEAYEAQSDAPAWWPARLTIAQDAAERSFDGRVHGLSGQAYVTFSTLVERRGGRNVHADLFRGRLPAEGDSRFDATFVPPQAAAQVRTLIHQSNLKGVPAAQAVAAKEEAARIRATYGVDVRMDVVVAFDPTRVRTAEARRGLTAPGL